jgi:hypothetical protein
MTNEKAPFAGSLTHDDKAHDSRIGQLSAYLSRGWALVPLHEVSAGACSCRDGAECRSAGKHPRAAEWQRPENLVRDGAGLTAALHRWPSCNWGLATGLISGCWALDFDPRHVTDPVAVGAVLAECYATAAWIQGTPSGGVHFVFALPEDFVPNNGAGQLPAGFDVRGARRGEYGGGQIAVAPSVTAVGRYEVLRNTGGPLTLAPDMVTSMVRPAPPKVRTPAALPFSTPDQDAVTRYAIAGISGELEGLRREVSRRNDRAWRAAARVQELANGAGLDREQIYAAWWAAAAAHPDPSVTVPDRELLSVWASAERTVGDRPADLSGVGGPAGWSFGGVGIAPFAVPDAAPSSDGAVSGGGSGGAPGIPPVPVLGVTGGVTGVTSQVTGVTADAGGDAVDPVAAMLAQLLDVEQLRAMAPPRPLINGVLDLDTTAWLIGESGSYKSFVGLDLAAHVGLGRPWRGRSVQQGDVIYVVAEGARGMRLRVDAWEREHGPMKGVRFLPMPVQANGPAWPVLVELCRRTAPALVIIDTQARVTIGLDENSNSDMSLYAERVDQIKRATGACVLTVHHLGRNGTNARGASAIDGAQDAELRIRKIGQYFIELIMDKQKDQAEGRPLVMRLKRSEGGTDPETGRDLSSLVIDHAEVPMLGQDDGPVMPVRRKRALLLFQTIATVFSQGEGGTRADIRGLFMALPEIEALQPASRRAEWHHAWNELVARGRVMRFGNTDRFAVFAPPDGSTEGMLTMNTGGPEDSPPDGWSIHWPDSDRPQAVDNPVGTGG